MAIRIAQSIWQKSEWSGWGSGEMIFHSASVGFLPAAPALVYGLKSCCCSCPRLTILLFGRKKLVD